MCPASPTIGSLAVIPTGAARYGFLPTICSCAPWKHFGAYYGDKLKAEFPTGSGNQCTLVEIAANLARRLANIFVRDAKSGRRAVLGDNDYFQTNEHWKDYIPFYEYFHGDTGAGLGASHQTGWTALVASLLVDHGASNQKE